MTARPTRWAGDATEIAQACLDDRADLVIAFGGDGTINEVANGMVHSPVPLAILPGGTANCLAVETGIGPNPVRAAGLLGDFEPVPVSAGAVRDATGQRKRYFLLMAGAGLDAHIVANLSPSLKHRFGKGAYWAAGFSSLTRRLEELRARVDSVDQLCSFALAARIRNYGGDLEIARGASLLSENFEVMLFEGGNPLRYLKYFGGVLLGTAGRMSGVTVVRTRKLSLSPKDGEDVYLQLDGEAFGPLPAQIDLEPRALTVLLPQAYLVRERAAGAAWTTSPTR